MQSQKKQNWNTQLSLYVGMGSVYLRVCAFSSIWCGKAVRGRQDVMHHVRMWHPVILGNPTVVFFPVGLHCVKKPQRVLCWCKTIICGQKKLLWHMLLWRIYTSEEPMSKTSNLTLRVPWNLFCKPTKQQKPRIQVCVCCMFLVLLICFTSVN